MTGGCDPGRVGVPWGCVSLPVEPPEPLLVVSLAVVVEVAGWAAM
ncbi:MAG: hypothetical protein WAK93_08270 [Solirubrobacteraceae bacterium]